MAQDIVKHMDINNPSLLTRHVSVLHFLCFRQIKSQNCNQKNIIRYSAFLLILSFQLDDCVDDSVMKDLFKNYKTWCKFLGWKHSLRLPQVQPDIHQRKLLYMGFYLLIWGEASNVRFMPECLCYIFHNLVHLRTQCTN